MGVETAILGSAVLSAAGSIYAGNAAKQAGDYQASIAERNAKVAEQEKEILALQTEQEILSFRDDFEAMQSTVGVAYRKSGVQAGTGTALQVLMANSHKADKDIAEVRYNAELGKRMMDEKAMEWRLRGSIAKMEGRARRTAGYIGAGSSLLKGYAQAQPYMS